MSLRPVLARVPDASYRAGASVFAEHPSLPRRTSSTGQLSSRIVLGRRAPFGAASSQVLTLNRLSSARALIPS